VIILNNAVVLGSILVIRLLVVHVLAECVVRKRILGDRTSHGLLRILGFAFIRTALIWIAVAEWSNFWVSIIAFIATVTAEFSRPKPKTTLRQSAARQILYAVSLWAIWIISANSSISSVLRALGDLWLDPRIWTVALGYTLVIWPAGYLTGVLTAPWRESIQTNDAQGLQNAGLWIGRLERVLIVTAVLVDQFALIGFLVAAKSILRFADIQTSNNRQEAEYVLVGTLLSFTAAIAAGLLTKATLAYVATLLAT
jgi:hypothetical protein